MVSSECLVLYAYFNENAAPVSLPGLAALGNISAPFDPLTLETTAHAVRRLDARLPDCNAAAGAGIGHA